MALYDLQCNSCKKTSEWLIRTSDLDSDGNLKSFECPYCGNTQTGYSKLISSGTSFQLKGDGWYADGYSYTTNKNSSS